MARSLPSSTFGMPKSASLLLLFAATASSWSASQGPATVHVDETTFAYSVDVDGEPVLSSGIVSFMCGGKAYGSEPGGGLTGGKISLVANGSTWQGIERIWTAGDCGTAITTVRAYNASLPGRRGIWPR